MTQPEIEIMKVLSEAWNKFIELPEYHPEDKKDFMRNINAIQNIVSSRVAVRSNPEVFKAVE